MSAILVVSIVLRLTSAGLALYLLARIRDWRIALVAVTVGLMAVRQIMTLSGQPLDLPLTFDASWDELPGLAISVLVFLSLFFLGDLIRRDRSRADTLQETTGVHKAILDNALIWIAMTRNRKIAWANPYFTTMLGWTPEEYQGRSTRLIYPDDETFRRLRADFRKALKSGMAWDQEMQMSRKDGSLIDVRLVGRAIEPDDPFLGSIWLIEDISKQKRSDQERAALMERLESTTERLNHSQKVARLADWEYEPGTGALWWSDETFRLIGLDPSNFEPSLEKVMAMTHPDDQEMVLAAVQKTGTKAAPTRWSSGSLAATAGKWWCTNTAIRCSTRRAAWFIYPVLPRTLPS